MTVKVSKPPLNLREELNDLHKPTGIAGEAMLRAKTVAEQQALINHNGRHTGTTTMGGNVGIGDINPANGYLTIRGATTAGSASGHIMLTGDSATNGQGPQIVFSESGPHSNFAGASVGYVRTGSNGIGDLVFGTRATAGDASTVPTERMRIDSTGNLLAGTTSTDTAAIGFRYRASLNAISSVSDSQPSAYFGRRGSDGSVLLLRKDDATVGSISVTTSATSYNTSSDYRLKEDWQPIANATETFMRLKPYNFAWKVDGTRVDGFLAHELQEVIPFAATGEKDGMRDEEYEVSPAVYEEVVTPAIQEVLDEEGNVITEAQEERTEQNLVSEAVRATRSVPDMQGIDQAKAVPIITAALQQAITKIEELELRLSALEI